MKLSVFSFLLFALGACASQRPLGLELTPTTGEVAHLDGRLVTRAAADSLVLVASFEREDMEYLALDIEVRNTSGRAVEIDPARFSFAALDAEGDTLRYARKASLSPFGPVANPPGEAGRVTDKMAREGRRLKTARFLNTALLVAAIASDASSGARSGNRERWVQSRITQDGLYTLIQAKRAIDHKTFANRMQRYDFELYRWQELALRRTYLLPGESVRGFVYLPRLPDASFVKLLYAPPGAPGVALTFRQEVRRQSGQ